MNSLIQFFCERLPTCCAPKWWHGHAYYDAMRNRRTMVIYPFHWLVQVVWWLNWKWAIHRNRPSWIDRMNHNQ